MLLVDPGILKELLLHSNESIRHSAVKSLRKAFRKEKGVVSALLASLEEFGVDGGVAFTSAIKCFEPTAEDIEKMAAIYIRVDPEKSSKHESVRRHLEIAFLETPFGLIKENRTVFTFNRDLRHIYEEANRTHQLYARGGEYLWRKLVEHSDRGYEGYSPGAIRYGRMLVIGLKKYESEISHRILMNISRNASWHDDLEEYLVELAGELKLKEAIPSIYKILRRTNPDRTMHGRAMRSLGLIGGEEVVRKMATLYSEREEERYLLTEVFTYIPTVFTEQVLMDLLRTEGDTGNISFLIYALAEIFSQEGMKLANEVMKQRGLKRMQSEMASIMNNVEIYNNQARSSHTEHSPPEDHQESLPSEPSGKKPSLSIHDDSLKR